MERPAGQENGGRYGQVGIQVVQWAGAILDVLRATGISFGLGPLAGETGLARSAVQRIVQALQDIGWVTPAVPDGGVFPGPRRIELAVAGGRPAHGRRPGHRRPATACRLRRPARPSNALRRER